MPGATAFAASPVTSNREAFLSDALLSARISAEGKPGAISVGLFPYDNWRYWTCARRVTGRFAEPRRSGRAP